MAKRRSETLNRTARLNGRKITRILIDREGTAPLFRTVTCGPSGQLADFHVGSVRYTWDDPFEMAIYSPEGGEIAGYARRADDGSWTIYDDEGDRVRLVGWADTLSVGVDVLIFGQHAALGRHDSRRISQARFRPFVPKPL